MTSRNSGAAIDAPDPTSRSAFRRLARLIDATNRDADTLRHALMDQWAKGGGAHRLVLQLQSLDVLDPDDTEGVDARLAVWFSCADPGDGTLVRDDDSVLDGISDELRNRLTGTARPTQE